MVVAVDCPCDYSAVPQTVTSWGPEVIFRCPTATSFDTPTGFIGTLSTASLTGKVAEVVGVPFEPNCVIVAEGGGAINSPITEPELRACEADVLDYLQDLIDIGITTSSGPDPSTCIPVAIP